MLKADKINTVKWIRSAAAMVNQRGAEGQLWQALRQDDEYNEETGARRQEQGDRSKETGARRQEQGDRSKETGARRQEQGDRRREDLRSEI
jgi:hypothetical protein